MHTSCRRRDDRISTDMGWDTRDRANRGSEVQVRSLRDTRPQRQTVGAVSRSMHQSSRVADSNPCGRHEVLRTTPCEDNGQASVGDLLYVQ